MKKQTREEAKEKAEIRKGKVGRGKDGKEGGNKKKVEDGGEKGRSRETHEHERKRATVFRRVSLRVNQGKGRRSGLRRQ